ncbi:MAG: hypothetical protein D6795_20340 [Deltaproteobacteria bacterium]|nr:MAG: hypothetical protein D6795_20340 [Deltaproteobacteria bacterium]
MKSHSGLPTGRRRRATHRLPCLTLRPMDRKEKPEKISNPEKISERCPLLPLTAAERISSPKHSDSRKRSSASPPPKQRMAWRS